MAEKRNRAEGCLTHTAIADRKQMQNQYPFYINLVVSESVSQMLPQLLAAAQLGARGDGIGRRVGAMRQYGWHARTAYVLDLCMQLVCMALPQLCQHDSGALNHGLPGAREACHCRSIHEPVIC